VLRTLRRPVCFRKRLVQCSGEGVGLPFLRVQPTQKSFPNIQPFTRSPERLAAIVAVDDWDFFGAFVAPALSGRTEDTNDRAIDAGSVR